MIDSASARIRAVPDSRTSSRSRSRSATSRLWYDASPARRTLRRRARLRIDRCHCFQRTLLERSDAGRNIVGSVFAEPDAPETAAASASTTTSPASSAAVATRWYSSRARVSRPAPSAASACASWRSFGSDPPESSVSCAAWSYASSAASRVPALSKNSAAASESSTASDVNVGSTSARALAWSAASGSCCTGPLRRAVTASR